MGILDSLISIFGEGIQCPSCGTPGAKKSEDRIRCPNPKCVYFDPLRGTSHPVAASPKIASKQPDSWPGLVPQKGSSSSSKLAIRYRNFRNESKTFQVDAASVKRKNNHILAREQASGRQISLARDRIQNMSEVDLALPERDRTGVPRPSAHEKQVLNYHKKYKTTSPLHRKIKAKYPDW